MDNYNNQNIHYSHIDTLLKKALIIISYILNAIFFSSVLNIGITIIKYRTEIKDSKIMSIF